MKILILTQYYPPETGAPQNRLHGLATRLKGLGADVEVLTAMPNYPVNKLHVDYRRAVHRREEIDGVSIQRTWIYVSKSRSMLSRLLNYFSFVFTSMAIGLFTVGRKDIIFCESPPLFLGISAWWLKLFKARHLVFNVSDLWPESAEKLGLVKSRMLLGAADKLESFMYKKSSLITGQTQGIVDDISNRFPNKKVHWTPNGVDLDYFDPDKYDRSNWRGEQGFDESDFIFLYAGILGHAQGLEVILHAAEQCAEDRRLKFVLLGDGPESESLKTLASDLKLDNVRFLSSVPKSKMPGVLSAIDVAIVPLRKLPLFEGAIPSKIFESLAMRVPILLGVDGEARVHFVDNGECAIHFEPENVERLVKGIKQYSDEPELRIQHGRNGRSYVKKHFTRDGIAGELMKELSKLI